MVRASRAVGVRHPDREVGRVLVTSRGSGPAGAVLLLC